MLGFNAISANAISSIPTQGVAIDSSAILSLGSAFSNGFSFGYEIGPLLIGSAILERAGIASLPVVASTSFKPHINYSISTLLQSQLSFSPNGVLLLGGTANISSLASITGLLTNPSDSSGTVNLTLYLDKGSDLTYHIYKTPEMTLYSEKQRSITSYIDEIILRSQYIDKQKSFNLTREK
jgi:hypothetical protein